MYTDVNLVPNFSINSSLLLPVCSLKFARGPFLNIVLTKTFQHNLLCIFGTISICVLLKFAHSLLNHKNGRQKGWARVQFHTFCLLAIDSLPKQEQVSVPPNPKICTSCSFLVANSLESWIINLNMLLWRSSTAKQPQGTMYLDKLKLTCMLNFQHNFKCIGQVLCTCSQKLQ